MILASVNAPDGSTLEYTNRYAQALEKMGQPFKEFDQIFANVGNPTVAQASVVYRKVALDERKRSTMEMPRELPPQLTALAGVTADPITPPSLGLGFVTPTPTSVHPSSDSY